MTIGEKIKEKRKEKSLSMEKLAKLCGLAGRDTINKYESGIKTPSFQALEKIAAALDCDLEISFKQKLNEQ